MTNLITDRQLLQDCADAFDALPIAANSRKMLKRWNVFAGNGNRRSHVLARYMAETIRLHLDAANNDKDLAS